MTRRILVLVFAMLALPLSAAAQVPVPTPTPDPWVYDDPAMHFVAPRTFYPVGRHLVDVNDLGEDSAQTVAGWAFASGEKREQLLIQQEAYNGGLDGWDSVFESQLRGQFDSPLFRDKQHVALSNGMPAIFMSMISGTGFTSMKAYMYIWSDGARGVAVILTARIDDVSESEAKKLLSNCSAVRYPLGRDY